MALHARPMELSETEIVFDYFLGATPEHLEMMGVDPTRLPTREAWRALYERELALPLERRTNFLVLWLDGDTPLGFSTVNRIRFGEDAFMHLHVVDSARRAAGIGAQCVTCSVDIYFETLMLKRLYCEPNAFNTAPNRAVQKAGFKYVKTYWTVPGWINFHQPVTRWVLEREDVRKRA